MGKKNSYSIKRLVIIGGAAFFIMLLVHLFIYDFSYRVDEQIQRVVSDHLADVGKQSVTALRLETERVLSELQYTADYIAEREELDAAAEELLIAQLQEKCHFSKVRLVSADGKLYSSDHELLPDSNGDYIDKIMAGESGMTDVFTSSVTGGDVFTYYAPIIKRGKVKGGITGTMIVDEMMDRIDATGFDGRCYSYILNQGGSVIIQTTHKDSLYMGRSFFQFLHKEVDASTITADILQFQMKSSASGIFSYRIGEEERLAYYTPTGINNWYDITVISTDVTDQYVKQIKRVALEMTVKISIIFLFLGGVIILESNKTRRVIIQSKAEAEVSKKKMELAITHSSNLIFEYDVKKDDLIFITSPEWGEAHFPPVIHEISEQAAGMGLLEAGYAGRFVNLLRQVASGKTPDPVELLGGHEFKKEFWLRASVSPVKDRKGNVVEVIGTMEDITQEKVAKRRFAQEAKYREVLLSEAVITWSVNLEKQQVTAFSVNGRDQMGERDTIPYNKQFFREIVDWIHPEDRERVVGFVRGSRLKSDLYMGKSDIKLQFRMHYPGAGDYKWVSCTMNLLNEPSNGDAMAFAYVRDVDKETKREMELSYSSERDPLTGLYNRRKIAEKVGISMQDTQNLSCFMMMDLDGFKGINDRFGHQQGDDVLKQIAQILIKAFRSDDLVARLGGDEFVVFLDHLPDKECAYSRAEDVRRQVYGMILQNSFHEISISIGIAFAPENGSSFTELYQKADEALYQAKNKGKNQIVIVGDETL